ncbi:SDR family NAD(P)-dependent oxidoreductase [Marinicella litoralis]|nr:SDR family NAD(P)-dependent oxidoreductase [Marinicella litoralis]
MTHITFIAGGSKGLGAAMVDTFKAEKHVVYEFSRTGRSDTHIACDFTQPELAQKTFNKTFKTHASKQHDSINLLINTAILAPFGSITRADNNTINAHLNINIDSTLLLIQSFLTVFQNNPTNKTITYISSGAARRAIPGLALYSASKAFFERLIDTLATEQAAMTDPIRCMVINPGVMNTDMQTEIRAQSAENFPMVDMWNELHRKGQLADPHEVAAVCAQLVIKTGVNGAYYSAQELFDEI